MAAKGPNDLKSSRGRHRQYKKELRANRKTATGQAVDFTGNPNLLSQKTGNSVTDAPTEGASRRFRVRSRPNRSAASTGRPTALQNANRPMVIATANILLKLRS